MESSVLSVLNGIRGVIIFGSILAIVVLSIVLYRRRRARASQETAKAPPKRQAIQQRPTQATKEKTIRELLSLAHTKTQRLTMKYKTGNPPPGEPAIKVRNVDIYGLGDDYFEAYCHYRADVRIFKISRILWARITNEIYDIPNNYVPNTWVTEGWGDIEDTEDHILKSSPAGLHKHSSLASLEQREGQHPIPRAQVPPPLTRERAKSYARHDWQKHWEESIVTLFPEEWSPALPYLHQAYKLELEGADQQKVEEMLEKAHEADPQATAFYKGRRSIIRKARSQRRKNQSKE